MFVKLGFGLAIVTALALAGWYLIKVPPGPDVTNSVAPQADKLKRPSLKPRPAMQYEGLSAQEWGNFLFTPDRQNALKACKALKVMGAEGRPQLFRGLDSPHPESRRLCLEHLSPSDLRSFGEPGRQALLRLSGDGADVRIRERASAYLAQWNRAIPARQ